MNASIVWDKVYVTFSTQNSVFFLRNMGWKWQDIVQNKGFRLHNNLQISVLPLSTTWWR